MHDCGIQSMKGPMGEIGASYGCFIFALLDSVLVNKAAILLMPRSLE